MDKTFSGSEPSDHKSDDIGQSRRCDGGADFPKDLTEPFGFRCPEGLSKPGMDRQEGVIHSDSHNKEGHNQHEGIGPVAEEITQSKGCGNGQQGDDSTGHGYDNRLEDFVIFLRLKRMCTFFVRRLK